MNNLKRLIPVVGAMAAFGLVTPVASATPGSDWGWFGGPRHQHDECSCFDTKHKHGRKKCKKGHQKPRRNVPELSGSAAGSSLALVAGGLLVLGGRRRKNSE